MNFRRVYGVATVAATDIYLPIIKRAAIDFAVSGDWTPAAGDVKVSKDGGAAANIATLPTALTMGNTALWRFQFSASELQCKQLLVTVADAATKAVEDQAFIIETVGHPSSALWPLGGDAELRLAYGAMGLAYGTVGNGTNTTTTISISGGLAAISPAASATDEFKGRVLVFAADTATAGLRGQATIIDGNSGTAITIASANALGQAATNGDTFAIY